MIDMHAYSISFPFFTTTGSAFSFLNSHTARELGWSGYGSVRFCSARSFPPLSSSSSSSSLFYYINSIYFIFTSLPDTEQTEPRRVWYIGTYMYILLVCYAILCHAMPCHACRANQCHAAVLRYASSRHPTTRNHHNNSSQWRYVCTLYMIHTSSYLFPFFSPSLPLSLFFFFFFYNFF